MVSNTLILTGLTDQQLNDDAFIHSLQQVLLVRSPPDETTQFIILKTFRRILIIFSSSQTSTSMRDIYRSIGVGEGFACGFSSRDYSNELENYLELPNNSRMFLISPPASPPVGFDYHAVEEEPNKLQIYTHEDIKEMFVRNEDLQQKLEKGFSSTKYSGGHRHQPVEFGQEVVLNDSEHGPRIILHPINGEQDHLIGRAIQSFRTSLPPKSVFDDLD